MDYASNSNISIEEEALLYLKLSSEGEKSQQNKEKKSSNSQKPMFVVCGICGEKGHTQTNCPRKILSLEDLQTLFNNQLADISKRALESGEYNHDSFGIILNTEETSIPLTPNIPPKNYCPNCGLLHSEFVCPKPSLDTILKEIGDSINSRTTDPAYTENAFFQLWNP